MVTKKQCCNTKITFLLTTAWYNTYIVDTIVCVIEAILIVSTFRKIRRKLIVCHYMARKINVKQQNCIIFAISN